MKTKSILKKSQSGSLMIEALAMLGLITMVTPLVYKKTAERTTEMQDINESGHLRIISRAVDDFIKDNYADIADGDILDPTTDIAPYLPQGFTMNSKLFSSFNFVTKVQDATYNGTEELTPKIVTGFTVATPSSEMPMMRASRIASMIGTNGGFVNSAGDNVNGIQGIWEIPTADLVSGNLDAGTIVTSSIQSIAASASSEDFLYRTKQTNSRYNTMKTDLLMNDGTQSHNIKGAGNLDAVSADLTDYLNVTGASTLSGTANIGGLLTAETGIGVTDGGITVTAGNLTVAAGETNLKKTTVNTGASQALTVTGATGGTDALKVTGGITTDSLDTDKLTTDKINVANAFSAGAADGDVNSAYSLVATNDKVLLNKNTTLANGMDFISEIFKIDGTAKEVLIGSGVTFDATGNMTTTANIDATYFDATDTQVTLGNATKVLTATDSDVSITPSSTATITAPTTTINSSTAANIYTPTFQVGSSSGSNNLLVTTGTDKSEVEISDNVYFKDPSNIEILRVGGVINTTDPSVHIRDGVVHVGKVSNLTNTNAADISTSKYSGKKNYINVDRMVSNTAYTDPYSDTRETSRGTSDYDRYQVNPAYTSVMNDIKLATRGGARLSDILPDYITKDIYVTSNTYNDLISGTTWSWSSLNTEINATTTPTNFSSLTYPSECASNNATCEASPWQGFVPAPRCPPGYSKIATASPLRFNMAQAYINQYQATFIPETDSSGNPTGNMIPNTSTPFDTDYLVKVTNPHLYNQQSLSFQASTWLNLYLEANNIKSGSFKGWHTVMGFIYSVSEYEDFITTTFGAESLEACSASGTTTPTTAEKETCVIWNLIPVYNQELGAVVTTYCYFERGKFNNTGSTVDTGYNQITNYQETTKGINSNLINDPDLNYTDMW